MFDRETKNQDCKYGGFFWARSRNQYLWVKVFAILLPYLPETPVTLLKSISIKTPEKGRSDKSQWTNYQVTYFWKIHTCTLLL